MQALVKRIGVGGMIAIAAVLLAAAFIGNRLMSGDAPSAEVEAGESADPLAELEQRSLDEPENIAVWQELGFTYFDAGRFDESARAFEKAVAISPDNAVLWSSLGEALVMASRIEPIPAEALAAFEKAIALDSEDPRARFFLAVKEDLDGDHDGAIASLLALLEDTPSDAPWASDLRRTIEQIAAINDIALGERLAASQAEQARSSGNLGAVGDITAGEAVAAQAIPGPTAEQMAAAGAMRPSEQDEMVAGMVASLAARLETEPNDVNGWIMLMRSYVTLGQSDDAKAALDKAIAANPSEADTLREAAGVLGL